MNFISRLILVAGLACASILFNGCASTPSDEFFSDPSNGNSAIVTPTSTATSSPAAHTAPPAKRQSNDDNFVAKFHVGDTVTVTFSGLPMGDPLVAQPHTEPVKEDGTIDLPYIGKVTAAGKTAGELQNDIQELYVPSLYRHLTVTVSTGDRVYYVRGEVHNPGRQLYVGETTVTRAIASAGDFTDFANHSKVLLIRANGKQTKVNCDRILDGKDPDPPVYPGDQIYVRRRLF
ncbi:MAG TPA: polysaccharide biosynthesis/export family protein [Verrucomicrobiae bacterium]|nr:polysaccharide biosynthesis/export family protein [Verrucomicrobiae bacterium]